MAPFKHCVASYLCERFQSITANLSHFLQYLEKAKDIPLFIQRNSSHPTYPKFGDFVGQYHNNVFSTENCN
ncbi:CFF_HP2_G0027950.mRNA.1.CDS.1 [Saccharomyces cerevisiae]|nr:CFF_HP2_G0027950.mRNA.1.CDS.1 [Saccharomyces cerevisiae]CAI6660227.1 CFF_HP2_G0027950.mRNA.1.CDS.1 [Saccharomyces cerevisiae]